MLDRVWSQKTRDFGLLITLIGNLKDAEWSCSKYPVAENYVPTLVTVYFNDQEHG